MKIAQVAPLYEAVPPKLYGGTERVVHYLTEELIALGMDVTLFASGDSSTSATLVSHIPRALRLDRSCEDTLAPHFIQLQEVIDRADEFDIIHFHTDYLNFPFTQHLKIPHITTLHGKLTIPELQLIYRKFPGQPVISISKAQRKPLTQANFVGNVYHGLPKDLFKPGPGGDYLAFLGRISPEKGLDKAIEYAIKTGLPLKLAAKVDRADQDYFEEVIKPLLDHPLIEYIGEINEKQKEDFLGNARALMFTINWDEPFGLVMIESMACGTPVIAFERGSVPEIIDHGVSGFIVHNDEEALSALDKVNLLERSKVRNCFDEKFTSRRMAMDYLEIYRRLQTQKIHTIGERKLSVV